MLYNTLKIGGATRSKGRWTSFSRLPPPPPYLSYLCSPFLPPSSSSSPPPLSLFIYNIYIDR